jgi:hypothetical protein
LPIVVVLVRVGVALGLLVVLVLVAVGLGPVAVLVAEGIAVAVRVADATGVLVLVEGVVAVAVAVAAGPCISTQAENSEVLPLGSVAVEVTYVPPGTGVPGSNVKLALPLAPVLTTVVPTKVLPSP